MPKVELKKPGDYLGANLFSKITGHIQQILKDVDYDTACLIAEKIDRDLMEYDGIQLQNGTTFEKTFECIL